MLLDIEPEMTKVVICRHQNLLFARLISIGAKHLGEGLGGDEDSPATDGNEMITRLVLELTGCRRHFASMYRKAQMEHLIFLSGETVNKQICTAIAKQLELPAQMGDCLAAVEMPAGTNDGGIDRRGCKINWATAFGLSLS